MKLTLPYLAVSRLGELEHLTANAISPMHDLAPLIAAMQQRLAPDALAQLDARLQEEKLTVEESGAVQAAPELCGFLRALYAPEKCVRTRMNEPGGCSDTYYIPFAGAWLRLDAIRGELSVTFPLPAEGMTLCLTAAVQATLQDERIRLLVERREGGCIHSAVILAEDQAYRFVGSVVDTGERSCTEYIHSFAGTEENRMWITDMLTGKREFVLPEREQSPSQPPQHDRKRALKGFLTALAVNVCAAVILAVLNAVL